MSLTSRRHIKTIAARNRSFRSASGRFACIGKDVLAFTSPGAGVSVGGIDEENCGVTFVVTSNKQDRDGDVIQPRGIDLGMWKRSPVWFWNHQQNPYPIGTGRHPKTGQVNVIVTDSQIAATCYFDQADEEAMKVYGKICRGFISACSIGFVPKTMNRLKANRDRMSQPAGYDVEQAELVEISITGVGSNRDAFVVGRSFGSAAAIRNFGVTSMKNRIKHLPTKKVLGNGKPISETEKTEVAKPETPVKEKSPAADVQHVAMSKEKFPNQADAMRRADKQGLSTDDVQETDSDWTFHQFPEAELVPDSGKYDDIADGIKAFVGQRVTEPASDVVTPEAGKDGEVATEGDGSEGGDLGDENDLPNSARAIMDAIAHTGEHLAGANKIEDPDVHALYTDMNSELKRMADEKHPEFDLYDKGEEETVEGDEKPVEEKSFAPYLQRRSLQTKAMSRKCMKSIGAAADHLDDVADAEMGNEKSARVIKAGCRYHAKELRAMVKEPTVSDDANEFDDETEETAEMGKAVVLSLKDDMLLATKAKDGYEKLSKQALGR